MVRSVNKIDTMSKQNSSSSTEVKTIVPHAYQEDLLQRALEKNIIVPLGTGTGKTYIAVMLLKEMAADTRIPISEGGKRSVFLADKVPLVRQQAEQIRIHSSLTVGEFFGAMGTDLFTKSVWEEQLEKYQVLVMTAQILMNMLVHGYVSLSIFNVIVFDECHHTAKNHPYRLIMARYEEMRGKRPRILGLTASVVKSHLTGTQLKQQMGLLETIMCSTIETTAEVESYMKVATKPRIELRLCCDDKASSWIQWSQPIVRYTKDITTLFKKANIDSQDNVFPLRTFVLDLLSKAKSTLSYVGLWSASRVLLRREQLLKETFEGDISQSGGQREGLFFRAALCYLEAVNSLLRRRVGLVNSVDQLKSLVIPRVAELLNYLRDCNPGNSTAGEAVPFCGIIFVTRRYVAYQLKVLLEEVTKLDADTYGYLKVGFVVGRSQKRAVVQSELVAEQSRHQDETLRKFRNGELNLIIATSILEEGIDVPHCNVVIRFDPPSNFSSFVQSKGRARMRNAKYVVFMQKSARENDCNVLKSYIEMEEELLKHRSKIAEADSTTKDASSIDSLLPAYYGPQLNGLDGTEQAVVTLSTALYVLNRYCMALPRDEYTVPSAKFEVDSSIDSSGLLQYSATLHLPLNCPVKEKITGSPMANQKLARMAAALKACELLHKKGELTDHMLPASKYADIAADEMLEEDQDEFVEFTERKGSYFYNRREMYRKKLPAFMSTRLCAGVPLFLSQVQIRVSVPLLDSSFDKVGFDVASRETFGLLCGAPLPPVPKFEIFATEEQVYVQCVSLPQPVTLSERELASLLEVQHYMFSKLLKFNSASLTYSVANVTFCVVPLVGVIGKNCAINWALVSKLLFQMGCHNKPPTEQARKRFVYDNTRYIDAVVSPWYHKPSEADEFIRVVAVRSDLNPSSPFDFSGYRSFEEYYEKRHNLTIFNLKQPLLCGDYIRPRPNMIHQRVKGESRDALMKGSTCTYTGSMFVPELVHVHPLPWTMWFQLTCLPTVLHRLRCLAIADELRSTIQTGAFLSEDGQLAEDETSQTIDSNWYRMNGYAARSNRKRMANESSLQNGGASEPSVGLLIQFEGMNDDYFANGCGSEQTNTVATAATATSSSARKELDDEELFFGSQNDDDDLGNIPVGDAMEASDSFSTPVENSRLNSPCLSELSEAEPVPKKRFLEPAVDFCSNSSVAVASFFKTPAAGYPSKPQLREMLLALTCASAMDHFDMENSETLGDSFIKYAVAVCLVKEQTGKDEGKLTELRKKQVSNANLCRLGKRIGLCGMIVIQEFKPMINWLPPGFAASELDDDPANAKESLLSSERQLVPDKRVADCVEALIGVYVRSCGHDRTLKFMEWLGLTVISEAELIPPAVTSPEELSQICEKIQLEKFERILRYEFKHRAYLVQALTHSSYCRPAVFDDYERMEFLGDAVLDYLITRFIYERELYKTPGLLTDMRTALVNNTIFASIAVKYDYHKYLMSSSPSLYWQLENFVKLLSELDGDANLNTELCLSGDLDNPEKDVEELEVPKVLGDIFESVAGAIYLDSGCSLEAVWRTYYPMMKVQIEKCCADIPKSPVRQLLEFDGTATFASCYDRSTRKTRVKVTVKGEHVFTGLGKSRWLAKNTAAKRALHYLKQVADQNIA